MRDSVISARPKKFVSVGPGIGAVTVIAVSRNSSRSASANDWTNDFDGRTGSRKPIGHVVDDFVLRGHDQVIAVFGELLGKFETDAAGCAGH